MYTKRATAIVSNMYPSIVKPRKTIALHEKKHQRKVSLPLLITVVITVLFTPSYAKTVDDKLLKEMAKIE